jgi:hypothetical protein
MQPLTGQEKKSLLEDRIYHRMAEVNLCANMAQLLASYGRDRHAKLMLDGRAAYESPSLKELSDPVIDTGIVMCRVLMEFLGVRCRNGVLLQVRTQQADDVSMADFGLPFVTPDKVAQGYPGLPPIDVSEAMVATLSAANKGIGHLTRVPARKLDLLYLEVACRSVLSLMNRHLYQALGYPERSFTSHVGCWVKEGRRHVNGGHAPNSGPQTDG